MLTDGELHEEEKKATAKRASIAELMTASSHRVQRHRAQWKCTVCEQTVSIKKRPVVRLRLTTLCKGVIRKIEKNQQLLIAGVAAHQSHDIRFAPRSGKKPPTWFCYVCGAKTKEGARCIQKGMKAPCVGEPAQRSRQRYDLNLLRKAADAKT